MEARKEDYYAITDGKIRTRWMYPIEFFNYKKAGMIIYVTYEMAQKKLMMIDSLKK